MNNIKQLTGKFLQLCGLYIKKGYLLLSIWWVKHTKSSSPAQPEPLLLSEDHLYDEEDPWTY